MEKKIKRIIAKEGLIVLVIIAITRILTIPQYSYGQLHKDPDSFLISILSVLFIYSAIRFIIWAVRMFKGEKKVSDKSDAGENKELKQLHRLIGLSYGLLVVIILTLLHCGKIPLGWDRLFWYYSCALLGLAIRAGIHYGVFVPELERDKKVTIAVEKRRIVLAYMHYVVALLAFCSLIYVASYELAEKLDLVFFGWLSLTFFFYSGIAVSDVVLPYFRKKNE